ncbi:glucose 1-dehydrogenase [Nocardia alni]|uniref:glucose 1-dehydrogenase n=1 Tax=Nocardia alni TaxID=2815723 RepID=UPI001C21E898|nr:glucose 1-dehydrogenase [Nocardia alni]
MGRYDGKTVLITGGTSGIGLVTAELLIDRGARVMVTGRNKTTLDAAAEALGPAAVAVRSDATVLTDIDALAERVRNEFGALDVLFANAGITRFRPFEDMDEATYDEVFTVNTKGPYFTVQRMAPLIRAGGAVVLTTSIVNIKGQPMISAYSASKAALRSLTRSLARELLPHDIRVNAVSPGPIDTDILAHTLGPEAAEQTKATMRANNPMQRFGRPRELAEAVAYLAFDATYTTGSELAVDGGASQL